MLKHAVLILSLLALQNPLNAQTLVESGQTLPGLWAGSAAWGDYDADGDQDLALMGEIAEDGQCMRIVRIYGNDEALLFEDQAPSQQLIGAYHGDLAWADYDNDGDLDLAVVGWDVENNESLRLYLNDASSGERVLALDRLQLDNDGEASLQGVRYASLAWADYDSDGDPDLIVSGMGANGTSLTLLYQNDGGVLQVDDINSETLVNLHNGDLAWADYDNDGDLDLAVSGENVTTTGGLREVTEFYLNDPTGTLGLDRTITAGAQVKGGALAWADYDSDGNLDLAIAGRQGSWGTSFLLYRNRPTGVLAVDETFNLNTTRRVDGDLAWIDYDNDGDLDLAATGRSILSDYQAFVFSSQDGRLNGVSTETLLKGLTGGSATWVDYDEDGRADLLLSGSDANGQRHTTLYNNQGTIQPNSTPTPPLSLNKPTVTSNRILFSWSPGADSESDELTYNLRLGTEPEGDDVFSGAVTSGPGNTGFKTNKILRRSLPPDTYFWSVQTVDDGYAQSAWSQEQILNVRRFVSSDQRLRAFNEAAMSWGDVDADGDFDLVIMGQNRSGKAQSLFYDNNNGVLVADEEAGLIAMRNGDVAWGDYDNDGDLDLLLTGEDTFANRLARLFSYNQGEFRNIGNFGSLSKSSADWGDYDNDGDLDLVIMGQSDDVVDGRQQSYSHIFQNDGLGGFNQADQQLVGLNNGEVLWGDYDNDGDLDLAATGSSTEGTREFSIYINEQGQLADALLDLPGLESSDLAWGDYDGDGDLDLAAGGISDTGLRTDLHVNDGNGGFAILSDGAFPGIQGGDLAWGDYDNDRDLDLVIAGNDGSQPILRLYENTVGRAGSTTTFELEPTDSTIVLHLDFSAVSFADIDSDGDLDLAIAGRDQSFIPRSVISDNLTDLQQNRNLAPETPLPQEASDEDSDITLSWLGATDDGDDTPLSLSYNLRVGTSAEGNEVLSGNIAHGPGNAGQNLQHRLQDLASGTYFWSVQTIDDGFERSEWSSPQDFIIDTVSPIVAPASLNLSRTQLGIGQTVTLALGFFDEHSGVDPDTAVTVQIVIGDETFDFEKLQFTGTSWSGQFTVGAEMPSGTAALRVMGAVDAKGNAMAVFDTVDVLSLDTTLPTVTGATPAMAASGISVAVGEVNITFSEAIDPATILGDNFEIRLGTTPLAQLSVPTYDEETNSVRLLPEGGLLPGSEYTIEVSAAIQDLAGNRPADATNWSFRTQIPQLVATSPTADALDAAGDGRITATFDTPILSSILATADAATVFAQNEAVLLRDEPIFDAESNTLVIQLADGFKPGTRYDVLLNGLLGGLLRAGGEGDFSWQFQTPVPILITTSPEGEVDATVSETIEATFTSRIDAELLSAETVQVTREGNAQIPTGLRFDETTNTLRFELDEGFKPGARYEVKLDALLAGPLRAVNGGDFSWQFQTPVPTLTTTSPEGEVDATVGETIEATFTSRIDAELLSAETVQVTREGNAQIPTGLRFDETTNTLRFELDEGFKPGARYEVKLDALLAGPLRAVNGGDFSWQFQTSVPELLSKNPEGEIGTVGETIEATFSSRIDEDMLDIPETIQVTLQGVVQTVEEVKFDDESNVLSLQLGEGFKPGALYEVVLNGLLAGPLRAIAEGDFTWQFRTPVPELSVSTPTAGQIDVATADNAIVAVFDNPVDAEILLQPGSVTAFKSGAEVAITNLEYIAETRTARLALAEGLRGGTPYQLRIAAAAGGPRRQSDYTWDFQTAIPEVMTITPADQGIDIGVDIDEVSLQFSAPIDPDQLTTANFIIRRRGENAELRPGDPIDRGDNIYGIAPVEGWQVGTRYNILLSPVVSGPLGSDKTETFVFSTDVPALASTVPTLDDTTVTDLNVAIETRFDAPINQVALLTESNVALLQAGESVAISTPAYDPDGGTVSFAPIGGLVPGTSYQVRIAAPVGGPLLDNPGAYNWSFSTRVPSIIATTPDDGTDIRSGSQRLTVAFSGPVNPLLLNSRNFTLSCSGCSIGRLADDEFSYDAETFTVSFPAIEMISGTRYEASVSSRVSGPLASQIKLRDRNWSFTTEIPQVVSTLPAADADGISTDDPSLQITFSEPAARQEVSDFQILAHALNDSTATAELLTITGFGANEDGTVLSFAPTGGFKPFTEYQVSMDRLVLGQLAESGFTWTFRTAASLADARQGGTISNADNQVEIYFPPNALAPGSNEISIRRVAAPAGKLVQDGERTQITDAYAIGSTGSLGKRATLTMRYSDAQLAAHDPAKLGIFRRAGDEWLRLGGTSDRSGRLVITSIEALGTFAVFEDLATLVGGLAVRELDCQPRAFTPRGGGLRDETDISFTLTGPADVTVRIYNASGRLERVIVREQAMAPGRVTLKWNGQNEHSELVASGLYIVAVDAGGEHSAKIVAVVQ